jgi:hypothetical protein
MRGTLLKSKQLQTWRRCESLKLISDTFNSEGTISVKGKSKVAPYMPGINIQEQKYSSTHS